MPALELRSEDLALRVAHLERLVAQGEARADAARSAAQALQQEALSRMAVAEQRAETMERRLREAEAMVQEGRQRTEALERRASGGVSGSELSQVDAKLAASEGRAEALRQAGRDIERKLEEVTARTTELARQAQGFEARSRDTAEERDSRVRGDRADF